MLSNFQILKVCFSSAPGYDWLLSLPLDLRCWVQDRQAPWLWCFKLLKAASGTTMLQWSFYAQCSTTQFYFLDMVQNSATKKTHLPTEGLIGHQVAGSWPVSSPFFSKGVSQPPTALGASTGKAFRLAKRRFAVSCILAWRFCEMFGSTRNHVFFLVFSKVWCSAVSWHVNFLKLFGMWTWCPSFQRPTFVCFWVTTVSMSFRLHFMTPKTWLGSNHQGCTVPASSGFVAAGCRSLAVPSPRATRPEAFGAARDAALTVFLAWKMTCWDLRRIR